MKWVYEIQIPKISLDLVPPRFWPNFRFSPRFIVLQVKGISWSQGATRLNIFLQGWAKIGCKDSCLATVQALHGRDHDHILPARDVLMICLLVFYPNPCPSLVWHISSTVSFTPHLQLYWILNTLLIHHVGDSIKEDAPARYKSTFEGISYIPRLRELASVARRRHHAASESNFSRTLYT